MKKLLTLIAFCLAFNAFNANALTLDERIAKVEARYEQRVEKINNSRYKDVRKTMLTKHAREDADLKIQHLKDLDTIKSTKREKKS